MNDIIMSDIRKDIELAGGDPADGIGYDQPEGATFSTEKVYKNDLCYVRAGKPSTYVLRLQDELAAALARAEALTTERDDTVADAELAAALLELAEMRPDNEIITKLRARVAELEEENAELERQVVNLQDEYDTHILVIEQKIVMEVLADPELNRSIDSIVYNTGIGRDTLKEMWSQMTVMGLIRFVPDTEIPIPVPWARTMLLEDAALTAERNTLRAQVAELEAQLAAAEGAAVYAGWLRPDECHENGPVEIIVRGHIEDYFIYPDTGGLLSDDEIVAFRPIPVIVVPPTAD